MKDNAKNEKTPKTPKQRKPAPIEHIRLVMECFCDLYTEGLTVPEIVDRTGLKASEIVAALESYDGLFRVKKFKTAKATIRFIYLRRARSLKCAYTLYKHSNISYIDFNWNQEDTEFIFEITNPLYLTRTFQSLKKALGWEQARLAQVIARWSKKGLICKKGKRVAFTYLGWPLWASIIVARTWMNGEPNDD